MGDDIGSGSVCFGFCHSAAEYDVYGRLKTIDNSLLLNPNRCHHPLISQLRTMYKEILVGYQNLKVFFTPFDNSLKDNTICSFHCMMTKNQILNTNCQQKFCWRFKSKRLSSSLFKL